MINEWTIGKTIRKIRESRGINQKKLCKGLCSVSTLCKFENGERELDYFLVMALMQRLGYGIDKYEFYGSNDEWEEWKQICTLRQLRDDGQAEKLRKELDKYQQCWKDSVEKNHIQKQFLTSITGVLERWKGNYKEAERLLLKAIFYTVDWNEFNKGNCVVSMQELEILIELGEVYAKSGAKEEAYNTWKTVWNYLEGNLGYTDEMLGTYISVVIKLMPYLLEKGDFWKGLEFNQSALKILGKHSRIDKWAELLYWKGKLQEQLLSLDEIEEEEVIKTYRRAYYAAKLFKENDFVEEIKSLLENRGNVCIK